MPRTLDIGTQLAHGPLRAYVMRRRGADNEPATVDDRAEMNRLAEQTLRAGALGVSTSRTSLHKASTGEVVPGTHADTDELFALADAIKAAGHGVFVAACEHKDVPDEIAVLAALSRRSGGRVTVNLNQTEALPDIWREGLARIAIENNNGAQLAAQVAGRAIGVLMGMELTAHPLLLTSTYLERLSDHLADRVAAFRDPAIRAAMLADEELDLGPLGELILKPMDRMFVVEGELDYEPDPSTSLAATAVQRGVSARALALGAMLRDDGRGLLYRPLLNYADGNLDMIRELHLNDDTSMGLSDAGAHCGAICDGGMPTFMLSFWTRDRRRRAPAPRARDPPPDQRHGALLWPARSRRRRPRPACRPQRDRLRPIGLCDPPRRARPAGQRAPAVARRPWLRRHDLRGRRHCRQRPPHGCPTWSACSRSATPSVKHCRRRRWLLQFARC